MSGRFVVLEGGDASGKTTQARLLAARLRERGRIVVETREPGGTALGVRLRALLLDGIDPVDPITEALLMAADRAQHVATVVRPALERDEWVVCDRFVPSSLVYQGVARGLGVDAVEGVNRWAVGRTQPDLVIVIDVDDDTAARRRAGEEPDRMEREPSSFHAEVRAAYRELGRARGWTVVDGSGSPADVAARVWAAVAAGLDP